MYLRHLSSLQFLTYVAFFAVVLAAMFKLVPGKEPPLRTEPYPDDVLHGHDRKLGKYFVGGAAFLVLGGLHMVAKNVPWAAEWLARAGYAGHLVRDLSNTHLIIVGGGTLIATGLTWYALPRIVGRPLASDGLAQAAFWLTAGGLAVFYAALVGNGIAIGRLVQHGMDYETAKTLAAVVQGAGRRRRGSDGARLLVLRGERRPDRLPVAARPGPEAERPPLEVLRHRRARADRGHRARRDPGAAGERSLALSRRPRGRMDRPDRHAHINLVTGLTMLVAGAVFFAAPLLGGTAPSRRAADRCFFGLLGGSLAFYASALYLGFTRAGWSSASGLTPAQAEEATALHPYLIMTSGIAMLAAFWFLLALTVRAVWRQAPRPGSSCLRVARRSPSERCRDRSRRCRP